MNLYLDLLKRILINSIYEDDNLHPVFKGATNPSVRYTGDEWPACAHTMIGMKRLENLEKCTMDAINYRIPGHFIETGVFRGGACILLAGILTSVEHDLNYVDDRKIYVCDSFEGFPKDRVEDAGDGCLEQNYYFAVSEEQVKKNFEKYGLLSDRVVFKKGWFKDTLPDIEGPFALIRLDGDMYSSTMDSLVNLYPKLSSGGFCIVDDYYSHPLCGKAVTEYRMANGITEEIIRIDNQGCYWRKKK